VYRTTLIIMLCKNVLRHLHDVIIYLSAHAEAFSVMSLDAVFAIAELAVGRRATYRAWMAS